MSGLYELLALLLVAAAAVAAWRDLDATWIAGSAITAGTLALVHEHRRRDRA